jgi:hypothetical protein
VFARKASVAAAIVVAVSGCGGGDDASPGAPTTPTGSAAPGRTVPEAAQPVAELRAGLDRLGPRSSCAEVVKLINPADLIDRTGGPSARNCASLRGLIGLLRRIRTTGSVEFRTAAIVEGTVGGSPIALEAALDQTRRFRLIGLSVPRHQVGTKPSAKARYRGLARAFVKALRDGDCKAAYALLAPYSRLAYGNEQQFCSKFKATFLTAPAAFGARLRADPGAAPIELGGTRDVQFFGVPTKPAGYRTIVVGKLGKGKIGVSDTVPVER